MAHRRKTGGVARAAGLCESRAPHRWSTAPAEHRVGGTPRRRNEEETLPLLEDREVSIDAIYVPAKRRRTRDAATVAALAESILEEGLKAPILVREDGARYVLVEGLQRLEACKALGEETIACTLVQARG